jgi:hypothetical protein
MNRALRVLACIALTGCHTYQLASPTSIQCGVTTPPRWPLPT